MKVELCAVSDIPSEGTREVEFFGRKVHVVLGSGGVPAAFLDICMHLGGPLTCRGGQLQCEWHQAVFDRETGERLSGPAPERARLFRLPTKEEDGVLKYVYGEDASASVDAA